MCNAVCATVHEGFPHLNLDSYEGFPHPNLGLIGRLYMVGGGKVGVGVTNPRASYIYIYIYINIYI